MPGVHLVPDPAHGSREPLSSRRFRAVELLRDLLPRRVVEPECQNLQLAFSEMLLDGLDEFSPDNLLFGPWTRIDPSFLHAFLEQLAEPHPRPAAPGRDIEPNHPMEELLQVVWTIQSVAVVPQPLKEALENRLADIRRAGVAAHHVKIPASPHPDPRDALDEGLEPAHQLRPCGLVARSGQVDEFSEIQLRHRSLRVAITFLFFCR